MRYAVIATTLTVLPVLSSAVAQERYATADFAVEVTGNHRADAMNRGHYQTAIKRVFRGTVRLKYIGHDNINEDAAKALEPEMRRMETEAKALTPQDMQNGAAVAAEMMKCAALEDKAAMQKCGLETANRMRGQIRMPTSPLSETASMASVFTGDRDLWATEKCSGQLTVADTGEWYGIDAQEGGVDMAKNAYALNANAAVSPTTRTVDACAISFKIDNRKGTVDISVDTGPSLIEAKETFGSTTRTVNITPLGWSSLNTQDINIKDVKLGGNGKAFSGSWTTSEGKPMDLKRLSRNGTRETYDTTTKISWTFRQ